MSNQLLQYAASAIYIIIIIIIVIIDAILCVMIILTETRPECCGGALYLHVHHSVLCTFIHMRARVCVCMTFCASQEKTFTPRHMSNNRPYLMLQLTSSWRLNGSSHCFELLRTTSNNLLCLLAAVTLKNSSYSLPSIKVAKQSKRNHARYNQHASARHEAKIFTLEMHSGSPFFTAAATADGQRLPSSHSSCTGYLIRASSTTSVAIAFTGQIRRYARSKHGTKCQTQRNVYAHWTRRSHWTIFCKSQPSANRSRSVFKCTWPAAAVESVGPENDRKPAP